MILISVEGSHTGGRRLLGGGLRVLGQLQPTGWKGRESVLVMTEAGAVPERVSGDIPHLLRARGWRWHICFSVGERAASLLGREGDSSVVEGVLPRDKGKGWPYLREGYVSNRLMGGSM